MREQLDTISGFKKMEMNEMQRVNGGDAIEFLLNWARRSPGSTVLINSHAVKPGLNPRIVDINLLMK